MLIQYQQQKLKKKILKHVINGNDPRYHQGDDDGHVHVYKKPT